MLAPILKWILVSAYLSSSVLSHFHEEDAPAPAPAPAPTTAAPPPPPPSPPPPAPSSEGSEMTSSSSSSGTEMKSSSSSVSSSVSSSSMSESGYSSSSSSISSSGKDQEDRYHPAHEEEKECKYTGEWGDCDPFKMIKIKEERLLTGPVTREKKKNTKPCHRGDFPPGTIWLLKEHKLCVQELQKLKTMIEDLHRYIDLIHQRGQALFNAYNDMRSKLGDVRNEISIIGRKNHDAEQTIARLRLELEDWRKKNNKIQEELNEVKAQAEEMERKVEAAKVENKELIETKETLTIEGQSLSEKLVELVALNKELKTSLLDAERYREEYREVSGARSPEQGIEDLPTGC